jgi:glucose-6-phosphate isomerase
MAIGKQEFLAFLAGAEKIDQHFLNTQLDKNIPVIMALISIWYRNFMKLSAYAVIPYDVRLRNLPAWLQQLMMESNGKMLDMNGNQLDISTSPWLFGDHGQLSQHAFFQAFHQGKDILPIDFIGVMGEKCDAQDFLLVNMLAQSAALMDGNESGTKQCYCPGNRPSTTFLLKKLSADTLGQLLALYEHMIFVQSVIWNINCFDQPGVELGKKIARNIVEHMQSDSIQQMQLDQSTQQLLTRVLNNDK